MTATELKARAHGYYLRHKARKAFLAERMKFIHNRRAVLHCQDALPKTWPLEEDPPEIRSNDRRPEYYDECRKTYSTR